MRGAAFLRELDRLIGGWSAGVFARVCAVAILWLLAIAPGYAAEFAQMPAFKPAPGQQMLVESDQLVYDYDNHTISAVGNVRIYYNGYTLQADKVTYIKPTRRLIATGRVKMTDPTGISTYTDEIDITDNFSDGFIQSLRVETTDETHFAAERGERASTPNGETTTFSNGVYTACEPCKEHPERPPLWQVQAQKIIVNHQEHMVYFHNAALEFMGVPIAWMPYFSAPDPTVKRKSGFLAPSYGYSPTLGYSVTAPYFFDLAPNYDLTVVPTYFTQQGFFGDALWRHRLSNGQYTIQVAGIDQNDPHAFLADPAAFVQGQFLRYQSGTYAQRDFRGGVRTTGDFSIDQYWSFGWDGTLSTDRTFTRNYHALNSNDVTDTVSNIHLTGIGDRSYFDARVEYFQVLTDLPHDSIDDVGGLDCAGLASCNGFNPALGETADPFNTAKAKNQQVWNNQFDQARQAIAAPVIDYNHIFADPILGGELSLRSNLTAISRAEDDPFAVDLKGNGIFVPGDVFYHGIAGNFVRDSTELSWQRQFIGPLGQLITPFASLRGDIFGLNPDNPAPAALTTNDSAFRGMPAVGVEWSWPVMMTWGSSTQVIEPMAQLIVRPNETMAGQLPNEDAQSLVFDDSNLFSRDKFSGWDRIEGGTRLNAGIHYVGTFDNGSSLDGLFGQSYQLAGQNPFAATDIADAGNFSGLQTDVSDYVGRLSYDTGLGSTFTVRGRFDQADFTPQRIEALATDVVGPVTATASYLYLRNDPNADVLIPESVVTGAASINVIENWRLFGSFSYDLTHEALARDSLGVAYDNTCLTVAVAYDEVRDHYTDLTQDKILSFRLLFRTLGEQDVAANLGQ
jgi:LPS-assembly protein